jgi:radical SAM-linked protein
MRPVPAEPAPAAPPLPGAAAPRAKYRVRFRKAGDLRLVSHHDLLHCFERLFRRADLPVPFTQGFNPRPRLWFAQSLALGLVGLNEVLELELTAPLPADELARRLSAHCPPGLFILSVKPIDPRASARVRRARYRLSLAGPAPPPTTDLSVRCDAFLAQAHYWIERTRPHRRRLDIRPFVSELQPCDGGLEMALWVTPYGAARPEEVVEALGLAEWLRAGAVMERTDLELADEVPDAGPLPAGLPTRPGGEEPSHEEGTDRAEDRPQAARPTAIITGPLSFDS